MPYAPNGAMKLSVKWFDNSIRTLYDIEMTIIGIILVLFGGFVSFLNWVYVYLSYKQKRYVSSIPLLGGLSLALGLYCLYQSIYAFFAIFADYGTIVCFWAIPYLAKDTWQTSRFRLEHKLTAQSHNASYTLNFFKSGVFTMKTDFDPPQACNEHGATIMSDGMQGNWKQQDKSLILIGYRESRKTVLTEVAN
ncbi:MAG: hypothetical protein ACYSOF_01995, partial [Planctomycetota bacterium]